MVNKYPPERGCFRHDSASHGCVTVRRVFPCGPGNARPDQPCALRRQRLSPEAVVHALRALIGTAPLSFVQFACNYSLLTRSCQQETGILVRILETGEKVSRSFDTLHERSSGTVGRRPGEQAERGAGILAGVLQKHYRVQSFTMCREAWRHLKKGTQTQAVSGETASRSF